MRPASPTRQALRKAIRQLCPTRDAAVPWPALVPHAGCNPRSPSERTHVRRTIENMQKAGEIERRGTLQQPGSRVRLALYAPAQGSQPACAGVELRDVTRAWVRTR